MQSEPSGAMTSGPCSASPTQRSPACSARKLRRSAAGPRTGRSETPAAASRRCTVERVSSSSRTTFARSSMRMMRRIERRGFSRLARTMSAATSGRIARLLPWSHRVSGWSASSPPFLYA